MKESNVAILTTRPLAHTVMEKAAEQGVQIDVESFIETNNIIDSVTVEKIRELAMEDISVVFTSMNAAEAVIDCLSEMNAEPDWTIYCTGGTTQMILKHYFTDINIVATANNSKQLADIIIENEVEGIVFFCGNQRREELPNLLQDKGIKVTEIVVYETINTPVKIDKNYNGILFFSPSAVRSFFSINTVDESTVLFAIGTTTAEALKEQSKNKVLMGSQPNKEQLAEQAIDYLQRTMNNEQ